MTKTQSTKVDERSLEELFDENVHRCESCGQPFVRRCGMRQHEEWCKSNGDES